jgi:hypothetical protein
MDYHSHFLTIAGSKRTVRRLHLLALQVRIKERYGSFDDHKLDLTSIPLAKFDQNEAEDLTDCYINSTGALEELLVLLHSNLPGSRRSACSYCGIGAPSTMDHYLPKSAFPEFAVMALNLLPCCYECNTMKGNVFIEGGKRTIFYLYADTIPEQPYLCADITYYAAAPVASFRLHRHPEIDPSVFARIESHYARLSLLRRYGEMANDYISEAMSSARTHCGDPGNWHAITRYLAKEHARLAARMGTNYWKAVLFKALASSNAFVNQCCAIQTC